LSKSLGKKTSALLFGARGVGKTRLCTEYLNNLEDSGGSVLRYDLLQNDMYQRFLKRPELFREEVEAYIRTTRSAVVFVDEVQKVPAILDEVHSLYEQFPGRVRFLLSGSSARKLRRVGANLLAGRAITLRLHPLLHSEFPQRTADNAQLGSLPGIVIENERPQDSLRSYVATYLKEEIQQEALVRKVDAFAKFLEVAGQYHGEILNASSLAAYAGVSSQTVAEYIDILEDTLLAWRLPGWHTSRTKQLRISPKLILFDNGVASALRGELGIETVESSSRYGKMFEARVIQECFRINDYETRDLKFSYWRTNNHMEVDLIVSRAAGRPLAAIEIKSSKAPEEKHVSGLKRFAQDYPTVPQFCVCQSPRPFKLGAIEVVPFAALGELIRGL
ncbi:MAG: ATP-binding protein, partial [Proteobacteria bacterium]|nr:ATP-binding protein [Pseudomonadota bacterium]